MPTMKKLKRMFGLDLTTLLKATNKSTPFVVEKCVEEIEARGMGLLIDLAISAQFGMQI